MDKGKSVVFVLVLLLLIGIAAGVFNGASTSSGGTGPVNKLPSNNTPETTTRVPIEAPTEAPTKTPVEESTEEEYWTGEKIPAVPL